ncbi:MAG: DegV family protein [Acutalibacter sp.]|jgi:DegV family protein with EDD domain
MGNFQIITDSTTDLTPALIEALQVQVIPLCYMMEGKTYHNIPGGGEMTVPDFYGKLRNGIMSTTTQVNSEQFVQVFTPLLEAGQDVLYIAFSSGLSGTCQSALLAREELKERFPDRRLEVFDSLCASMGEGLLVYHAAMLRKSGKSLDEVLAWLKENALKLCHWFTVDDLNHLKRGGRVSTATALVGTMLGIKPVLHVDDEGHLIPVAKVRGRKQSLDALVKRMEESAIDPAGQMVFISHGDCLEDARYVEKQIRERLGVQQVEVGYIGPVIGAHSGPGTVALFFLGRHR